MPSPKLGFYPASLAAELRTRWPAAAATLPPVAVLEEFIAVALIESLVQQLIDGLVATRFGVAAYAGQAGRC